MDPRSDYLSTHWSSYSKSDGPVIFNNGSTFMLSVILDAGAQNHFAGIRLVIVYEERYDLKDRIRDRLASTQCEAAAWKIPFVYRNQLCQHRDTIEQDRSKLLDLITPDLPLCPVVFRLIQHERMRGRFQMDLVPHQSGLISDRLRIAYDRAYPSSSVISLLESSLFVCRRVKRYRPRQPVALNRVPLHSTRILPVDGRRPSVDLPHVIVDRIARHATEGKELGWRTALASIGLVRKSWSRVLDLFFIMISSDSLEIYAYDKASVGRVSRSLEHNVRGRKLMRFFNSDDYNEYDHKDHENADETMFLEHSRAILTIFSLATSITHLDFTSTHPIITEELIQTLSKLRHVERCEVRGPPRIIPLEPWKEPLSIVEVQRFIAPWSNLQTLCLKWWRMGWNPIDPDLTKNITSNIQHLELCNGRLSSAQLLWFTSSPQPCLHTIHLSALNGLSNHDLFAFLSEITTTLAVLTISFCTISRSFAKEDYALDLLMPRLSGLKTIKLIGDYISVLAIERKAPGQQLAELSVGRDHAIEFTGLARAMETGHWKSISILWQRELSEWARIVVRDAEETAVRRGIALNLDFFPPSF
ncbi:hypothetical protein FPV67DRAFT_1494483 [Lyophyllum atratum]|nr:hypothetical protein FPV67DRAFT_1494483 [Lyophyllum atratum]